MTQLQIDVELIAARARSHEGTSDINKSVHPGLGEEGKYHSKGDGDPLPDSEDLTLLWWETRIVARRHCSIS